VGPASQPLCRRTLRPDWLAGALARAHSDSLCPKPTAATPEAACRNTAHRRSMSVPRQVRCAADRFRFLPALTPLLTPPLSSRAGHHRLQSQRRRAVRASPCPKPLPRYPRYHSQLLLQVSWSERHRFLPTLMPPLTPPPSSHAGHRRLQSQRCCAVRASPCPKPLPRCLRYRYQLLLPVSLSERHCFLPVLTPPLLLSIPVDQASPGRSPAPPAQCRTRRSGRRVRAQPASAGAHGLRV
jgi:hypothetical protein